jgi:hypothetical protein
MVGFDISPQAEQLHVNPNTQADKFRRRELLERLMGHGFVYLWPLSMQSKFVIQDGKIKIQEAASVRAT